MMVGEVDSLKYQVCALVRLCEARIIGDMSEVPIPTRFLFFLLGPTGTMTKMVEIGRSMSTIMVDQVTVNLSPAKFSPPIRLRLSLFQIKFVGLSSRC